MNSPLWVIHEEGSRDFSLGLPGRGLAGVCALWGVGALPDFYYRTLNFLSSYSITGGMAAISSTIFGI